MPACSRSSSGSQDVQVPARGKAAKVIPSKTEVAKRCAYSELEQLARKKIAETDWMWVRTLEECDNILTAYEVYAREHLCGHMPEPWRSCHGGTVDDAILRAGEAVAEMVDAPAR